MTIQWNPTLIRKYTPALMKHLNIYINKRFITAQIHNPTHLTVGPNQNTHDNPHTSTILGSEHSKSIVNLGVQVEMNKSNTTQTKQIDAIVYCSSDGKSGVGSDA